MYKSVEYIAKYDFHEKSIIRKTRIHKNTLISPMYDKLSCDYGHFFSFCGINTTYGIRKKDELVSARVSRATKREEDIYGEEM